MTRLKPSLMCMSALNVERDLLVLAEHFEEVHLDIMDAHFVPSIHLSPTFAQEVRRVWTGKIEIHLMVTDPILQLAALENARPDAIVVHVETLNSSAFTCIQRIREMGAEPGIAIGPSVPLQALADLLPMIGRVCVLGVDPGYVGRHLLPHISQRVAAMAAIRADLGLHFEIEVDGGVRIENFRALVESGADSLVVGNGGLFGLDPDLRRASRLSIDSFQ